MHTEHLQNVSLTRVLTGWLAAVAVTSILLLALVSAGLVGEGSRADAFWVLLIIAVGFWAGGFSIAFRALQAPILHGVAIGITSLVAWALANIFTASAFGADTWSELTPAMTVLLVLEQMVAAVLGTWMGYRMAFAGGEQDASS